HHHLHSFPTRRSSDLRRENISLVGRICLGFKHARNAIRCAQRFRQISANLAEFVSENGFCFARKHLSRTASARARSDGESAFCRSEEHTSELQSRFDL